MKISSAKCFAVAVLCMAGAARAQSINDIAPVMLYANATASVNVTLSGWSNTNVTVAVSMRPSRLASASVSPADSTAMARTLQMTAGGVAGTPEMLLVRAFVTGDTTTEVVRNTTVTVRALPTVSLARGTGYHGGHIDAGTSAVVNATPGGSADTYVNAWVDNTALITNVSRAGNTFTLTAPDIAATGTTKFFVVYKDSGLGGVVTNSLDIAVAAVPKISNLSNFAFDEDTVGTKNFTVTHGGPAALTYTAVFNPTYIIQSWQVTGTLPNMTLRLTPFANAYGNVSMKLTVSDGTHSVEQTITVTVNPVPDPPVISNFPAEVIMSNKDTWTNVFTSVTITDVDDFPPGDPLKEKLDVRVADADMSVVFGGVEVSQADAPASRATDLQTAWLRGVTLKARDGLFGIIGTTNTFYAAVTATGADGKVCTTSLPVRIWFKNTPPEFDIRLKSGVTEVMEGAQLKPFMLGSLTDPDVGQEHTLTARLAPESLRFGTVNAENLLIIGTGNQTTLNTALINDLVFTAHDGVMTNAVETVSFIFELNDGFDTTTVTNRLTLRQLQRPPEITLGTGAPVSFAILSDTAAPTRVFPQTTVTEPDEGGNQFVSARITISPPYVRLAAGDIDVATLQHPTNLTAKLRMVSVVPDAAALAPVPIGQTASATITLVATDKIGKTSTTRTVTVEIEKRNAAPVITVPGDQPVLFSPAEVIRPFANVGLFNDDQQSLTLSFTMDAAKGTFGNTAGLAAYGNGFTITAPSAEAILAVVTNVTFTLSATYPFPVDDPGGTTFTLTAKDEFLATGTARLMIQVQDPPRNWLVTNPIDDGLPGSFSHALAHFGNNDVITFALPQYPATVRLANAAEVIADKALTIKGPGADLLTLSGDTNGDGVPDRRFLTIAAPVTVEGVAIADCTGNFGGAFSVEANGHLTLRQVTVRNCVATDCGGAVDVVYGRLTVEACMFLDNAVTDSAAYGGGAISLFTDQYISFYNTVFARNRQLCLNGAGGGAINAEFPGETDGFLDIDVVHCTFTGNVDNTRDPEVQATSIFANGGSVFYLENNIFADDPDNRTLNTAAVAEIWSYGGNICDDDSSVFHHQMGGIHKTLLDQPTDQLEFDARLNADFVPANVASVRAADITDLAGRIRGTSTLSGALDPAAAAFPAVTEIQLVKNAADCFIEIYAPRGAKSAVNLQDMTLLVNGTAVHTFGHGTIANPANSTVFTAGASAAAIPATYTFASGHGVVVAFPTAADGVAAFQLPLTPDNPTPVVRASIVSNATDFAKLISSTGRGSVAIVPANTTTPIVHHTFLTVYNDPASAQGITVLNTGKQSIATVPQARGFAFLPHTYDNTILLESPGATGNGTPFGEENAPPDARDDFAITTEDDAVLIDVLANDSDPDGDPLTIVRHDLVSALGAAVVYDAVTGSLCYDPTVTAALQLLPAGRELVDSFTYDVWDGRDIPLGPDASVSGSGPYDITCSLAIEHGLSTNDFVWIDGRKLKVVAVPDAKSFQVRSDDAVDADTFKTGIASTRNPDVVGTATVTINLEGLNDNPVGVDDLLVTSLTEREAVRLLAQPNLSAGAIFNEEPRHPVPGVGLLANDTDVDEGDTNEAFRITGVLSGADVHAITAIAPASDGVATLVTSPAHGLATGATITLVGIQNPARLNGSRAVTVIDADTFTLSGAPGVILPGRAFWIPSDAALTATTTAGAAVTLVTRANRLEDGIVYNAAVSSQLQALASGESQVDEFWYVLVDAHDAPGIARVTLTVNGVNNPPIVKDDPPCLNDLVDKFGGDAFEILTNRLAVLTVLIPPASGRVDCADLIVADKNKTPLTSADLLLLTNFFSTDENTSLVIHGAELIENDTDIDDSDLSNSRHFVSSVQAVSLLGAAISVDPAGANVTYNPAVSAKLRALGIGETAFDIFTVYISDGHDAVSSRVAVLVRGVNNKPVASPLYVMNPDAHSTVTFAPNVTDADAHDIFQSVTVDVPDPSLATNRIPYSVTDHSLFLALDDTFRVPVNSAAVSLGVLVNDVNFHNTGMSLLSVTPSLHNGSVSANAARTALLYTPPANFAGTDIFTYAVTNSIGVLRKANVRVLVVEHDYNGPLHACDDEYAVARHMSLAMPVTFNDAMLPNSAAGILVDPAYNADWPAGLTLVDNVFHYTAGTALNDVTFTYRALGGGGASAIATVRVKIIDRVTGIQPDWFTAAPGAAPIRLDLLANDILLGDATDGMLITSVNTNATAGAVVIDADQRSVTYAAPAGFIGIDTFIYSAIDRYGAVGTATVSVTVGVPFATPDSITVATNTVTLIDVLANDSTRPYAPPASLMLTGVTLRNGETANGVASVNDNKVSFAAGTTLNASAIWRYTAVVPNSSVVVTGEVTVVTSHGENLYANPDNLTVRANSANIDIDVLANDASCRSVHYALTIQDFQTVSQEGGAVTRSGSLLRYTPKTGFTGIDTFSYVVSDGVGVKTGLVTLRVISGDLIANNDAFIIGYEWDGVAGKAKAYSLPVLRNDAVFPGGAVALHITPNFGIGDNAPRFGSELQVSDDKQSILFRPGQYPDNFGQYVETFTYEVEDAFGRKQAAAVAVTVRLRVSDIEIETQNDAFNVERNSANNILDVAANDLVEPKTPLPAMGLHVTTSAQYGNLTVSGTTLVYTPPANFVGVDTARYTITDGLGGSGEANLIIYVGALPATPDTFTALRGGSYLFDVLANDPITSGYLAAYLPALNAVSGATHGAAISLEGGKIRYIPNASHAGAYPYTETFTYQLKDTTGRITTSSVSVTVYDLASSQASSLVYVINPSGTGSTPATGARQIWNDFHFTADQIANNQADGNADPDNDGLTNDAEYVFGGDPNQPDPGIGYIFIDCIPGDLVNITYTRRDNDPDLAFHLYVSDDLANWTLADPDLVSTQLHPLDADLILATHTTERTTTRRFYKVVVDLP